MAVKKMEKSDNILEKTKNHAKEKTLYLHSKFKEHSSTAIIAALSFVIGLTWKDFIVKIVDNMLKQHIIKYPYLSELITAMVVTVFAIIAMTFVSRWAKKPEEEKQQEEKKEILKHPPAKKEEKSAPRDAMPRDKKAGERELKKEIFSKTQKPKHEKKK